MANEKKYASLESLQVFLNNLKTKFITREIVYIYGDNEGKYEATIDGYTSYTDGDMINIIPLSSVEGSSISLNINNLGDKKIYRPCSNGSFTDDFYDSNNFILGYPYTLIYIKGEFYCNQLTKPYGEDDFVKPVAITSGGTGAKNAADALKNLGITATATELNKMVGATSNVQEQLTQLGIDISNTDGVLRGLIDNKADSDHSHNISDMEDYNSVIGGIYGDISGMWSTFDSKADANHTHTVSDITDINDLELITVADIDTICATTVLIPNAEEVSF